MKECPLRLIALVGRPESNENDYACIEERCQFWVQTKNWAGCAFTLGNRALCTLAAIRGGVISGKHAPIP